MMSARSLPSGRDSRRVLAAATLSFILSGCGGGSENLTHPPGFLTGARPAPGTATYEPVPDDAGAGAYAFPWELYQDGPECREADPPATCPPVRIGIEDTPVAFTHPVFHGRVVLDGATFAYWRPLASEATRRAFAQCTEAAPCRVFHIDSGGDPEVREDRARAVLERVGLPDGDDRWFLYDRAGGEQGWYELPGFEDYAHGTQVALVALGARFHPFPFPDPVIVPMARNFDPIEQREGQHYFSDLLVEGRGHVRTWREDFELLRQHSPRTWAEYAQSGIPEEDRTLRVWATGNHDPGSGLPPSVLLEEPFDRFPSGFDGDGHRSLEALGPYYFPELRGEHVAATALSIDEERRAPYVAGVLAHMRARFPGVSPLDLARLSGLSLVAFDALNFPFRYSIGDFVDDAESLDPMVPEFLSDRERDAACHPLLRLAPGLVCSPWVTDASLHALVSPDGAGASWRFSEGLEFSDFTRHRGRLDGAARGAFSFDGGSSLPAVRLGRSWPLDRTGQWRMQGTLTLAADLPRGFGERSASMLDAGPAILSDWSIGLAHASRDLHTRLSLSQPPRAETGRGTLRVPIGRREDGTRSYQTRRFSLVPSRRQLTLRLAHQRPFVGGDVVVSMHRTKNMGHSPTPSRFVAGIAWRRSF